MSDHAAVWLEQLQQGDSRAAQQVWERYFEQLVRVARRKMGGAPRRAVDEEDVALSALNSFVDGARAGRFPRLDDETDLWRLLVTITARKANAQRRRHFAVRRNRGRVRGESAFEDAAADSRRGIENFPGQSPTADFAAEVAEECRALFARLDDPQLCDIARWKMEGFSNEEIAAKLGRNVRTVERKLALIRDCWSADD